MIDDQFNEPPAIAIFGIPFHDLTLTEVLRDIDQMVERREPGFIVTPNLDFAAQASRDVELHRIILGAHRILCDGMPLVWSSRLLGSPLKERVAGSDLVPILAEHAAKKGHRLYFLGSTPEVLEQAREILVQRHPGLRIVGVDSPPFVPLSEMDQEGIAGRIRAARPDILLVALGCPKQEKWIWMNHQNLGVPCSIGIGASLDFIAGKTHRAPRWMQKTGTEWIFRLLQEPRRLLGRYAWDFCFLVSALTRQLLADRRSACPMESLSGKDAWTVSESERGVTVDLSGVVSLNNRELGRLLRLFHATSHRNRAFVLSNPSASVHHLLEISGLGRLLQVADGAPSLPRSRNGRPSSIKVKVVLSASVMQGGKSGVAQYVFGLLNGLARFRGELDLTILGFPSEKKLFEPWLDWCRWADIPEMFHPPVANIFWHQTFLRSWLRREKIEVLHIPSYRRIVFRPPCRQLVTIHDCGAFALQNKYDVARTFFGRRVVPALASQADQIVAVSKATAADVSRYFGLSRESLKVVHNGIDHGRFHPPAEDALRRWKSDQSFRGDPYFIYIARLEHPAKNHLRLIEAFEKFKTTTLLPHRLLLGGADWHGAEAIHQRIHTSVWRDSIRVLGFVKPEELPFWYAGAVAMVYPSLFEGFGFPPLEAMACGCPVICSGRGSLAEITGEACLRIDPENIGQIAAALEHAVRDPKSMETLKNRGFLHCKGFTWEHTGNLIFGLYKALAGV